MRKYRRNILVNNLGNSLSDILDIHFIDVRRASRVDGIVREVYSNVPAHVSFKNIDNPDPAGAPTAPVIVSVSINMRVEVDAVNGDEVVIKIPDKNVTNIKDAFIGIIGDPKTVMSRKKAMLTMRQLGRDDIRNFVTPLPQPPSIAPDLEKISKITIRFLHDDEPVREAIDYIAKRGEEVTVEALALHGFAFSHTKLNGESFALDKITFFASEESYAVDFIYDRVIVPIYLRLFSNGRFRRDDGGIGNGPHWYQVIPIAWDNGAAILPTDRQVHLETRAVLQIRPGARVLLEPQRSFASVVEIERIGESFRVSLLEVAPTQIEAEAYITDAYGVWG